MLHLGASVTEAFPIRDLAILQAVQGHGSVGLQAQSPVGASHNSAQRVFEVASRVVVVPVTATRGAFGTRSEPFPRTACSSSCDGSWADTTRCAAKSWCTCDAMYGHVIEGINVQEYEDQGLSSLIVYRLGRFWQKVFQ